MKIPRYIDSAPQLLFWEIDEFMVLAACFGVGILAGSYFTIVGLITGFVIVNAFKKFKANGLPGQLNHLAHWSNILNINPSFPNSGARRITK